MIKWFWVTDTRLPFLFVCFNKKKCIKRQISHMSVCYVLKGNLYFFCANQPTCFKWDFFFLQVWETTAWSKEMYELITTLRIYLFMFSSYSWAWCIFHQVPDLSFLPTRLILSIYIKKQHSFKCTHTHTLTHTYTCTWSYK